MNDVCIYIVTCLLYQSKVNNLGKVEPIPQPIEFEKYFLISHNIYQDSINRRTI